MSIRAVICDVYNTLLEVGPPPADAAARWEKLWRTTFKSPLPLSLEQFAGKNAAIIERNHVAAKATGVAWPEVFWPAVAIEAIPDLEPLSDAQRDEFLYQHAQLQRTVSLMPGAADVLSGLATQKKYLGLASNAQPYTLRELDAALAAVRLERSLFRPELCFWSFMHGFSKPDPHVFRMLRARLLALGVTPHETLMVGDRLDNDIEPARAQGWQTWHLSKDALPDSAAGSWQTLGPRLGVL
jgi:FMN phosphatase YigB (HAD superfamily)